jgi:hypothetical protein
LLAGFNSIYLMRDPLHKVRIARPPKGKENFSPHNTLGWFCCGWTAGNRILGTYRDPYDIESKAAPVFDRTARAHALPLRRRVVLVHAVFHSGGVHKGTR